MDHPPSLFSFDAETLLLLVVVCLGRRKFSSLLLSLSDRSPRDIVVPSIRTMINAADSRPSDTCVVCQSDRAFPAASFLAPQEARMPTLTNQRLLATNSRIFSIANNHKHGLINTS